MSKRSAVDKIGYYQKKIKKLEEQERKRYKRVIVYSDSSDAEENVDNEAEDCNKVVNDDTMVTSIPSEEHPQLTTEDKEEETIPTLDHELLSALGDTDSDEQKYGENIHQDLAHRWLPLLRKGLTKETRQNLLKAYLIPENCKLLRAPTLNPEIAAALTDAARNRDKKIEVDQQKLGLGITAVNRAMSLLLIGDNKVQAIKILSDACRILSDLHHSETQTRIKLVTPGLDKCFLKIIHESERDETLFGNNLPQKIKALKAIEKQGLQIKKTDPKPSTSQIATSSSLRDNRYQENWRFPSRSQNKRGRGGPKKSSGTRRDHPSQVYPQTRSWSNNKSYHAPVQQ
ncbi:unnamed protein product [Parnassius mnemosyne]|uniref:Uncharacterized protein n=1 Tax=Parnassius mnemosyne TaxID=213953 RepID=A0AAV1KJ51_9NEOP